jgi:hypothetical protein
MDGTDAFKRGQGGGDANPFAEKSYSDQFVRSATQPLVKRQTRPLEITPEVLKQQAQTVDEQIRLCRAILERFGPRVKLLKAANDAARQPVVVPPEPSDDKKGAKPSKPKKPAGPAVVMPPGSSPQDRMLVDKIITRLKANPDLIRRATIAVTQFEEAGRAIAEANGKLNQARVMPAPQAYQALEAIEVTKLQGRVYPICNFYEVFKDDELIAQLFPPPAPSKSGTGPLNPQPKRFGFGR